MYWGITCIICCIFWTDDICDHVFDCTAPFELVFVRCNTCIYMQDNIIVCTSGLSVPQGTLVFCDCALFFWNW